MKKTSLFVVAFCCGLPLISFCHAAQAQQVAAANAASTRAVASGKAELDAALLAAIRANNLRGVTSALQQGADANARSADAFRTPALSSFDKKTDLQIVRALLDAGADLEATDAPGNAPLAFAAIHNRLDVIALLLARGADLESRRFKGMTPLMIASASGSAAAVRALLDAGGNVGARSDSNGTALFYGAANDGNIGLVKALVAAGVDVGAAADNGKRAVDVAAENGAVEINNYLVGVYNRDNALLGAASQAAGLSGAAPGHWNAVRKALDGGASGRFSNAAGTTALMLLSLDANGFDEATALRVLAVSDVSARESGGNSALHLAADRRNEKMIARLLAAKAALNTKNKDGQTPLDVALAQANNEAVVALLRAAGAQTSAANTPIIAPLAAPTPRIETPISSAPIANAPIENAPIATAPLPTTTAPKSNTPLPTATQPNALPAATPVGNATNAPQKNAPEINTSVASKPEISEPAQPKPVAPALAKTAPINALDTFETLNEYGRSPLMQAARDGNAAEVARLLQRGARVDFANADGQTALFFAARGDSEAAIQTLAQAGANLNLRDKNGEVALVAAAFRGNAETLRALVQAGADLRVLDDAIAKARSGIRGAVDNKQRATSTATYRYLVSLKK